MRSVRHIYVVTDKRQKQRATIHIMASNETPSGTADTNPIQPTYDRWSLLDPSTISYGYYSGSNLSPPSSTQTSPTDNESDAPSKSKGFYITTAINYTNGPAHMGHAYESATTDAIARFARLNSKKDGNNPSEAYFVTG